MNRYIKSFINENMDLIDLNSWDTLYSKLWALSGPATISEFTQVLAEASIFPIYNLKNLPEGFHFNDPSLSVEIIPDNVEVIGEKAYSWCTKLNKLIFKTSKLNTIGPSAFEFCTSLKEIEIPKCVHTIAQGAFSASGLEKLTLNEGLLSIEKTAFLGTNIQEVILPKSLVLLDTSAFPSTCLLKVYKGSILEQNLNLSRYKVEYIE